MTTFEGSPLTPLSSARRRWDRTARALLLGGTVLALVPLVLVIYYILKQGLGSISGHFFTSDPTGNFLGDPGGAKSAIIGTVELVLLASVIAIPIGIAVALYLTEYGRGSRFAGVVRYFLDVMTGVPSIIFGLFIYTTLVVTGIGGSFTGWKGSVALALLMLPVVARSAEVVLLLVPDSLREAALALGSPRWRIITRIILPTALPGLITGSLLAVARAAGETAPLIFTTELVFGTNTDPSKPIGSLPALIYNDVTSPNNKLVGIAWGAALTLVAMILLLTLCARLVARRSRLT